MNLSKMFRQIVSSKFLSFAISLPFNSSIETQAEVSWELLLILLGAIISIEKELSSITSFDDNGILPDMKSSFIILDKI